ncbi:MAG: electron transfer flavoprotein subunit alpha [Anaerolineae bacterium]|nr:electron transfer flavoprotein subunit alpha [Anaerolineae bacterium]NIN97184.1 electron transfer flavoprotein subunit alpha [Anaerolineae bacterium]NIQ80152.1 electron transfer flavoprotein subunit alpha [Anaerolineae bacterium]
MHVWAVGEIDGEELAPVSYQLIGAARDLADLLGVEASAVLLGKDVQKLAEELIWRGADRVYVIEDDALAEYSTEGYGHAVEHLINERKPEIVLFGATDMGEDLAPRLAQELKTGLLPDCTRLELDQAERILLGTRPTYDGGLMVTNACPEKRPQMATVRPGAIEPYPPSEARTGEIEKIGVSFVERALGAALLEVVEEVHKPALQEAKIVVAGGRGVGGEKGFQLLEQLAQELGGAVGASRGAFDEGWVGKEYWVGGAGGTPVAPDLYIACGISGAIQHYLGIKNARFIVAINNDPRAPIFKFADVGIVGDLHEVVTALIDELRAAKS